MKKYVVEISETAEQDLENIISYLRFSLAGDYYSRQIQNFI